jgi:hypothetical protein
VPRYGHIREQTPHSRQSRNHGLPASISSCWRFAASQSASLSGLASDSATIRSSNSISAMVGNLWLIGGGGSGTPGGYLNNLW